MYGLADCNNFFVSCERVFRPDLEGKPVIILSNNDGCVISRSNEAKRLGIKMGHPYFQLETLIKRHNVAVFSSNFALYGDMSRRVQQTLKSLCPETEVYSIDESFLNLRSIQDEQLDAFGHYVSNKVRKDTGIPISVGISHTKTLAKIASKLCKQYPKLRGSCYMHRPQDIEKVLRKFPIEDVWGIGRRFSVMLKSRNINTAFDFARQPLDFVRGKMHVGGMRTWYELHGRPCIEFESHLPDKQQIMVSRSFSTELSTLDELTQQISLFTSMAAEKLRKQKSVCQAMHVFLLTNRFRHDQEQHYDNQYVALHAPSDSTVELVDLAVRTTAGIFRQGTFYKKAGVILSQFSPKDNVQTVLFDEVDRDKHDRLMFALDSINEKQGQRTVVVATAGFEGVRMNRNHLSPNYTTDWNDILTIKV
ncbi:MAG: Y-family DNA polymerase [Bacteroidales bacterium]|nr:Y-family DNA polymerase [Bacteroidales bacterium]